MDDIAKRLQEVEWLYGDKDPQAHAKLKGRIEQAGRKLGLITYSDLVRNVVFRLPNLMDGKAHVIEPWDWTGLDRRIVGDFLGHISMETYMAHGFMASALVVNRAEFKPSDIFFGWMEQLGYLKSQSEDDVLAFWADQVNKAHNFYRRW